MLESLLQKLQRHCRLHCPVAALQRVWPKQWCWHIRRHRQPGYRAIGSCLMTMVFISIVIVSVVKVMVLVLHCYSYTRTIVILLLGSSSSTNIITPTTSIIIQTIIIPITIMLLWWVKCCSFIPYQVCKKLNTRNMSSPMDVHTSLRGVKVLPLLSMPTLPVQYRWNDGKRWFLMLCQAYTSRWQALGLPQAVLFIALEEEKNELDHRTG